MTKNAFVIFLSILFFLLIPSSGVCLNSEDIIRLKKAAVSDKTIELIIKEKVIETCFFTIQEILIASLLNTIDAWTGEKALLLRMMGHGREPIWDGYDFTRTIGWFITTPSIINLYQLINITKFHFI